jgi:hypothetical protein
MTSSASGAEARGKTMYEVRVAGPDDVHTHADELSALRQANQINQAFLAGLLKHPDPADQVLCVATVHGEATGNDLLAWACGRWREEVQDRPMVNKNRRTLDDTWRQVVRYAGGNPDELLGPSHDTLLARG